MHSALGHKVVPPLILAGLITGCSSALRRDAKTASPYFQSEARPIPELEETPSGLARLTPRNLAHSVRLVSAGKTDEQAARQRYQEGQDRYRQALTAREQGNVSESRRHYVAASKLFLRAADLWPDSSLAEDALFHAAEGQFFADRYPKASHAYDELVKKYPNTKYMDQVAARQFKLAEYWLNLNEQDPKWLVSPNITDKRRPVFDTFGNALKVFDNIRFEDPTGKLSDDATMAAANACFADGRYDRAETLYADVRESFPQSEHQFNAHLLGLKCKLLAYEGPEYGGAVLDESEELIKRMFRLFPVESKQHREYLENALRDIRLKKAEREWIMARYYDRRKEYGAARHYYEIVRREYAETSLAERASTRLAEIAPLPDAPPKRMEWLADLFPKPERAKPLIARDSLNVRR